MANSSLGLNVSDNRLLNLSDYEFNSSLWLNNASDNWYPNLSDYEFDFNSSLGFNASGNRNLSEPEIDFGPKRDSLSSVIPMTVIYAVILVTGLVGNICTCVVIIRNKHMRTVTNYYLFSLAISDLLLLVVGLPQELYLLWNKYPYVFGEAFCIMRGFTAEMSTYASILTITLFTLERYFAICHPLKTRTMSRHSRTWFMILGVWIISGLSAIHVTLQLGIIVKEYKGQPFAETAECTLKSHLQHAFLGSTLAFFILPMIVISVLYVLIGMQLRQSSSVNRNRSDHSVEQSLNTNGDGIKQTSMVKGHLSRLLKRHSTRSIQGSAASSRKAVIKMLFAVVVAFFLCWAPFHAQRLMAIYVVNLTPTVVMIYQVLFHISGVTYYVSATINPILYSIMSNKFRQAFKNTLAHCGRRDMFDRSSLRYSSYAGCHSSIGRSNHNANFNNNSSRKKEHSLWNIMAL